MVRVYLRSEPEPKPPIGPPPPPYPPRPPPPPPPGRPPPMPPKLPGPPGLPACAAAARAASILGPMPNDRANLRLNDTLAGPVQKLTGIWLSVEAPAEYFESTKFDTWVHCAKLSRPARRQIP